MDTASTPWALFRAAGPGDHLEEVVETDTCKVLHLKDDSGDGVMTIYHVFDGVYLIYNDFHLAHCASSFPWPHNFFCIDHCREGRIEHRTEHDLCCYMEAGDICLNQQVHQTVQMDFPLSHYHGITIGFQMEAAQRAIRQAMPELELDLAALAHKFCGRDGLYLLRRSSAVEHVFSELYHIPSNIRMEYLKLKLLELLVFLRALELTDYKDERPYFYSSQIEKIKGAHRLLTENLAVNYTTEELANRVGLSPSTLKNGFKGVYGSPIYTYIRAYKMKAAATILAADRKKRIIDVAASVGYDNPSKFAAAFKEMFHMTPAEYRSSRQKFH